MSVLHSCKVRDLQLQKTNVTSNVSSNVTSNVTSNVIKLGNCESLCLPCKNLNVGKIDTPGYGIPIGSITKIYPSGEADYFSAIFELTPNIINKIEEHGIFVTSKRWSQTMSEHGVCAKLS